MDNKDLIKMAMDAMQNAYAPYSEYTVGAALLCKSGKVYLGCNVENAAFGCTNCAERTAFFKAVSEGEREFLKIAIVGGKNGVVNDYFWPCGTCRQVMTEFCDKDFEIIVACNENDFCKSSLPSMLPYRFSKRNISK